MKRHKEKVDQIKGEKEQRKNDDIQKESMKSESEKEREEIFEPSRPWNICFSRTCV